MFDALLSQLPLCRSYSRRVGLDYTVGKVCSELRGQVVWNVTDKSDIRS